MRCALYLTTDRPSVVGVRVLLMKTVPVLGVGRECYQLGGRSALTAYDSDRKTDASAQG